MHSALAPAAHQLAAEHAHVLQRQQGQQGQQLWACSCGPASHTAAGRGDASGCRCGRGAVNRRFGHSGGSGCLCLCHSSTGICLAVAHPVGKTMAAPQRAMYLFQIGAYRSEMQTRLAEMHTCTLHWRQQHISLLLRTHTCCRDSRGSSGSRGSSMGGTALHLGLFRNPVHGVNCRSASWRHRLAQLRVLI